MRRWILMLLSLLLALPAFAAAEPAGDRMVISCPEEGFSTLLDQECVPVYDENDGLYLFMEQKGYFYSLYTVSQR